MYLWMYLALWGLWSGWNYTYVYILCLILWVNRQYSVIHFDKITPSYCMGMAHFVYLFTGWKKHLYCFIFRFLWRFQCECLCGHMLSSLFGLYWVVELLCHLATWCLVYWGMRSFDHCTFWHLMKDISWKIWWKIHCKGKLLRLLMNTSCILKSL